MTNGDKVLKDIPNATARLCKNRGFTYIEVEQDNEWIGDFSLEWWHLEYEESNTKDEAIDKVRAELVDTGAYEQEVHGKTEFLKCIDYCIKVIDKCKEESKA